MYDGPTIMMCPPDYYGIEYEINPWMSQARPSDQARAAEQWRQLFDLLLSLGADVRLQEPVPGLPDLVFTANAGLVHHDCVYLSQFRHPARQGETPVDREWFQAHGLTTIDLPQGLDFEGAGDALFCGDTLYAGYQFRSLASSMQWVGSSIGCRVIPLQLVDERFYHLDTCFCPLDTETAIYYPPAFDDYGQTAIKSLIPSLFEVNDEEAERFACNAVVVGKHVVLNTGCPQLEETLSAMGFTPHHTELDEFLKAGGSAKCLTLRLDGEEAAIWPERRQSLSA
ncbi:dimethylarginine dimethylaminohydrolase family protein [Calycomorphotria hydatis]|uniref:N(G),N(G)-dimethylarginine dimethylaminohydrolase n=1 Tax=Calycomorphotria hydatis TaxID=2528027 RepID=A0A517T8H4_9PLAN|nr:arginine deiminase-related protein [Calycomorphotria hydatis]QDT64666.1 N(G),N(G)-dimethylarginine dimethylaminohydrolase [Calycomorphotria hydatis]